MYHSSSRSSKTRKVLIAAATVVQLAAIQFASGQTTYTWDGGGGDSNWGTAGNWAPDGAPTPSTTNDLVFQGSAGTSSTFNYTDGDDFRNIFFASAASAFTITPDNSVGGKGIDWFGGITNDSGATQTIAFNLYLQGGARTLTSNSGTLIISGAVFNNGNSLNVSGAGSTTISGTTTLQGSSQTFTVASGSTFNLGALDFTHTSGPGKVLTIAGAGNTNISGTISNVLNGSSQLAVTSTGITDVSGVGSSSNSGQLMYTIGSGATLRSFSNSFMGSYVSAYPDKLRFLGNGTFSATGSYTLGGTSGSNTQGVRIENGSTATFDVASSQTLSVAAAITESSGSGKFVKSGAGTLSLSGANTYTGSTTVNGGVLSIAGDSNLGTAPGVATANHLVLNSGALHLRSTNTALNTNRGIGIGNGASAATGTINVDTGLTLTYAGIIANNGAGAGSLVKTGPGTLYLSGANTFTGDTTIGSGVVRVGASSVAGGGVISSAPLGRGNLTINDGVTLYATSGSTIFHPVINITGNVQLGLDSTSARIQAGGAIDLGGGTRVITLTKANLLTNIGGGQEALNLITITGGNNSPIVQNGTLSLATTNTGVNYSIYRHTNVATFSGNAGLTIGDHVVTTWGTGSPLATGAGAPAVTVNSGGILNTSDGGTASRNLEVYSLAGAGSVINYDTDGVTSNGSSSLITINNGNGANFSGSIANGSNGSIAISKSGSGLQIFSGSNTYTGNTTISGGVLRANHGAGLPATSALAIAGGVLETGANFSRSLGTSAGSVQITGGVSGFSANGGAVAINIGNASPTPSTLTWGSTTFAPTTLVLNESTANNTLDFQNGLDLNAAARTINVNAGTTFPATISGLISGASGSGLTKGGTGVLILGNANTYSGNSTISSGILRIGTNNALPTSTSLTVGASATLELAGTSQQIAGVSGASGASIDNTTGGGAIVVNTSSANTFSGIIRNTTGTLSVTKSGTGTLTLSGANTYAGGTALNAGTLVLSGSSTQSGGNIASGPTGTGTVTLSGSTTLVGSGNVLAAPTLSILGDVQLGVTSSSGRLQFQGGIELNNAERTITLMRTDPAGGSGAAAIGLGTFISGLTLAPTVSNGGLKFVRNPSGTDVSWIQFSGASVAFSNASLTIGSNVSTIMGGGTPFSATSPPVLILDNGTLDLGNQAAGGDSANPRTVHVRSIAGVGTVTNTSNLLVTPGVSTLIVNGSTPTNDTTFSGTLRNGANNYVSLTKQGTSVLTLSNTNAYSGPTTISGGTLALGASGSIATSPTVSLGTGATLDVSAVSGFTLASSQRLIGTGKVKGAMTLAGTIAPGTSPGTILQDGDLTLPSGGTYEWEINSASGTAGAQWDLIHVTGGISVTATNVSQATNFTIKIIGLNASNTVGAVPGFNANGNYTYKIASTTTGVTGFDASRFFVDVSQWGPPGGANTHGKWFVEVNGNDLQLHYAGVPEPTALGSVLIPACLMLRRRKD